MRYIPNIQFTSNEEHYDNSLSSGVPYFGHGWEFLWHLYQHIPAISGFSAQPCRKVDWSWDGRSAVRRESYSNSELNQHKEKKLTGRFVWMIWLRWVDGIYIYTIQCVLIDVYYIYVYCNMLLYIIEYIYSDIYIYILYNILIYYTYIYTYKYTYTYTHTYLYIYIYIHIHTYTHTHARTHTQTYIHTYIDTYVLPWCQALPWQNTQACARKSSTSKGCLWPGALPGSWCVQRHGAEVVERAEESLLSLAEVMVGK